jgi:hypothetical protein
MKENLHTVGMSRPLALKGRIDESKHNLERPVEREFSELLHPTADKQTLLSLLYVPLPVLKEIFLSNQGRKGESCGTWNDGIMVNGSRYGCLGRRDEGGDDTGLERANFQPS